MFTIKGNAGGQDQLVPICQTFEMAIHVQKAKANCAVLDPADEEAPLCPGDQFNGQIVFDVDPFF